MKRVCLLLLMCAGVLVSPACAEEWPARPVRIVNTFAPGGAADILARIVADHLSHAFKQQFYVETRAGAGGAIGVQTVANTDPDGYNFVITTLSLAVLAPFINPKIGYDPLKDLTYVGYIAGSPILFIVSAKSGVRTLADFVAKARASAKPLTYGSSGLSSAGQMVAQSFAMKTNLEFEIVPYKGFCSLQTFPRSSRQLGQPLDHAGSVSILFQDVPTVSNPIAGTLTGHQRG